ncbi:MAG: hypothetical protein WC444_05815 [Candidatus Paceibacterota bacterium]
MKTPCSICNTDTESIRVNPFEYRCSICNHDKSLSDLLLFECLSKETGRHYDESELMEKIHKKYEEENARHSKIRKELLNDVLKNEKI